MLSSASYAEWTKVGKNVDGDTFYVDFARIKKHDGYVYWWELSDSVKPNKYGDLSIKFYSQGDCKLFRFMTLVYSFHKEPMGGGTGDIQHPQDKVWRYPQPDSVIESTLKQICSR